MVDEALTPTVVEPDAVSSAQFAVYTPDEDQKECIEGLTVWFTNRIQFRRGPQLKKVAGVAGSGKSATVGYLTKLWSELFPDIRIGFCTLTGKAAQVLNASLRASGVPASCQTIHSLIYRPRVDEETGVVLGWTRRDDLDLDLVIIDEASMVGEEVYKDIASYGTTILAMGDHKQLPPVGEPPFLMANPDYRFEKVHRLARGNPIIELATMARNGVDLSTMIDFIQSADDPRVSCSKGWDSVEKALGMIEDGGMLLVHSNRTRVSINHQARKLFYGRKHNAPPIVGELVICLRNQRTPEGVIANGQRGTIEEVESLDDHRYKMRINFGDGYSAVLPVSKHQFGEEKTFPSFGDVPGEHRSWSSVGALFDFGYALTVHKSQGSQDENVVILLTNSLRVMEREDRVRWVYTGFTRSAKNLHIITHL